MEEKILPPNCDKGFKQKYYELVSELENAYKKIDFYETLIDEFPIPIFAKNDEARFCVLNKAYTNFFLINKNEFLDKSVLDLIYLSKDYREKYQQEDLNAIKNSTELHYEEKYLIDEKITPALYWAKGFCAKKSKQKGLVGAIVDLSEQKRLENELAIKVEELEIAYKNPQHILDLAPFGVCVFDRNCNLIDINQALMRIFNIQSKEDFMQFFLEHGEVPQADGRSTAKYIFDQIHETLSSGYTHAEAMVKLRSGEVVPLDVIYVKAKINQDNVVICYIHDLRNTKAMINDIVQAKKEAEESAKAKSEFLANMSHEILTPLNGISGILQILAQTKLNSRQHAYIEKATFSTNILGQVINDILDISEIDTGKTKLENKPFTINEICAEIEDSFLVKALEKKIDFSVKVGEFGNMKIFGDKNKLKQVIANLLDNAIKFTEKGSISFIVAKLKSDEKSTTYNFSVEDSGIGIEQDKLENIFTAFTQSDSSLTRKYGGTGLGLMICKSIVEMMGGKIKVKSILGLGSNFYFDLTFDHHAGINKNEPNKKLKINRSGDLLLVEDNKINQLVASELLKKAGYRIEIANNGLEALKLLREKCFDLILMDIQMPVMDGLTTAKAIRENPKYQNLPIIALSAHSLPSDVEKSLSHGMNEHITKPVSAETLYSCIDKYLYNDKIKMQ